MTESEQVHSTLNGLNEVYKRTFEQAGWVVLAFHKISTDPTYTDKVSAYKNSINRLIKNLKSRLSNPQGNNTIVRDFPSMIVNLTELKSFFDNMGSINENLETVGDLAIPDITLYALQNFFKHVFHKLGWMVLTNNKLKARAYAAKPELEKHMQEKLQMYKRTLNILHQSLVDRLKTTNDVDKANVEYDLASMIRNIKILRGCVEAHLKADGLIIASAASDIVSSRLSRQSTVEPVIQQVAKDDKFEIPVSERISSLRQSSRPSRTSSKLFQTSETSDAPVPSAVIDSATSSAMPRASVESAARESAARESAARESAARESAARQSGTRQSGTRQSAARESATSDAPVPPVIMDSATSSVMPNEVRNSRSSVRESMRELLKETGRVSETSDAPVPSAIIDSATSSAMPLDRASSRASIRPSSRTTSIPSSVPSSRLSGLRTSATGAPVDLQSPQTLSANALADLVQNLNIQSTDNLRGSRTSGLSSTPIALPQQQVEIENIANQVIARQSSVPSFSGQTLTVESPQIDFTPTERASAQRVNASRVSAPLERVNISRVSAPLERASAPLELGNVSRVSAPLERASAPLERASAPLELGNISRVSAPLERASSSRVSTPLELGNISRVSAPLERVSAPLVNVQQPLQSFFDQPTDTPVNTVRESALRESALRQSALGQSIPRQSSQSGRMSTTLGLGEQNRGTMASELGLGEEARGTMATTMTLGDRNSGRMLNINTDDISIPEITFSPSTETQRQSAQRQSMPRESAQRQSMPRESAQRESVPRQSAQRQSGEKLDNLQQFFQDLLATDRSTSLSA